MTAIEYSRFVEAYRDDLVTVWGGDSLALLRADALGYEHSLGYEAARLVPDGSVDAVVTDPPYGLEFMGKGWDSFRLDDPGTTRWRGARAGAQGSLEPTTGIEAVRQLPAYGGQRPYTSRCLTCGKRDMMRNPHACGDAAEWARELTNPNTAPPSMQAFGEWCRQWAVEAYRVLKPGGHLVAFGGSRTWHRLAVAVEDAGFEIRDSIAWLYGSGFPKSMDVSFAIRRAGQVGASDWEGWGTAIKPAFEPIVVARKPLTLSVAANVLRHGTGALNVAACRVPHADAADLAESQGKNRHNEVYGDWSMVERANYDGAGGRWPTNVVVDDATAAELGQAARFFPRFRYEAKAPTTERPRDGEVAHPTVKPLDFMRWLVRLVTPPGGVVLDPFAGSGTTAEACVLEGFRCLTIEREQMYLPLIAQRLSKPMQPGLDFDLLGAS